ncbi:Accessory Sec system protein Asp3 [Balamuthia mandrillaris]
MTVQTGALWQDVIRELNKAGLSPRTMQSYSSFSVGGTLAVNAHGITSDFALAESVVSFRLVKADGSIVECSRPQEKEGKEIAEENEEGAELFGCALGGYGMFGIITEVVMKVDVNVNLIVDTLPMLSLPDFAHIYDHVLKNPTEDVVIKLARLDITTMEHIDLFLFRNASSSSKEVGKTISYLPLRPREMSGASRLIYKWLAPTVKELRFALEHRLGVALDWNSNAEQQRNLLMYESAEPLAKLFEPLFRTDDTFVLQEYFVPKRNFLAWVRRAKTILVEEHVSSPASSPASSSASASSSAPLCNLLNITVRFVHKDKDTALPYARCPEGSFAFVLYYRITRSAEGDALLADLHRRLVAITLDLNGTFYLPYRHHYSDEDLRRAYPDIDRFWEKKAKYDPDGLFDSLWRQRYRPSSSATLNKKKERGRLEDHLWSQREAKDAAEEFVPPIVSERREQSFRAVMNDMESRRELTEEFLTNIFNIEDPQQLTRLLSKCVWDPRNLNDADIYSSLQAELAQLSKQGSLLRPLTNGWKQLTQLRDQKKELLREVLSIVGHLGKMGQLNDYLSIGDHGKMVQSLRDALRMRGEVVILHDSPGTDEDNLAAVLERGSVEPVGRFCFVDYEHLHNDDALGREVAPESMDLVTINQGLHHLPQEQLVPFLRSIYRVLRPGGLFIVREHDCDEERHPRLLPMLDVAHMVFNAVTGVSPQMERSERRAFRSVLQWREVVMRAAGFGDTLLYEMQTGDPTWDEMMCFYKAPLWNPSPSPSLSSSSSSLAASSQLKAIKTVESMAPVILPRVTALVNQVPSLLLDALKALIDGLIAALPELSAALKSMAASSLSKGQAFVVEQLLDGYVEPTVRLLSRFQPHFDNVQIANEKFEEVEIIPPEVGLLMRTLLNKAKTGKASPMELIVVSLIKDFENSFTLQPSTTVTSSSSSTTTEKEKVKANAQRQTEEKEKDSKDIVDDEEELIPPTLNAVTKELDALLKVIPELSDPAIIENLGLNQVAQRVINNTVLSTNLSSSSSSSSSNSGTAMTAQWLVDHLDAYSWQQLRRALQRVRRSTPPQLPSLQLILADEEGKQNGWHEAAMAVLGSPKVQLSQTVVWQAWFVGLSDVVSLWKKAQQQRQEECISSFSTSSPSSSALNSTQQKNLQDALQRLQQLTDKTSQAQVVQVTMTEGNFYDLTDVAELIEAKYGYRSLTADYADVKEALQRRFLRDTHLRLKGRDLTAAFGEEGLLSWRTWDNIRSGLRNKVRKLKLVYRSSASPSSSSASTSSPSNAGHQQECIDKVRSLLSETGITRPLHEEQEEYWTWFKLNEWMQVEMVQLFGSTMEHTPWYRFPFLRFLQLYFSVLWKEVGIVANKFGWRTAVLNQAFAVDVVPAIAMSIIFAKLQLLAWPLKRMLGAEGESYDTDTLVEEVVVLIPTNEGDEDEEIDWKNEVDERIVEVKKVSTTMEMDDQLFVVTIPTFKTMTAVLCNMARKLPKAARLLEISNQTEVQVKLLCCRTKEELKEEEGEQSNEGKRKGKPLTWTTMPMALRKKGVPEGCEFKFCYRYPLEDKEGEDQQPSLCVVMGVKVAYLLDAIRAFDKHSPPVVVAQIYDFFN